MSPPVRAVELVRAAPEPTAGTPPTEPAASAIWSTWLALALIGALAAGMLAAGFAWWRRQSATDRAFWVAALFARLTRKDRSLLRRLAAQAGLAPVTLLISEHAFERAAAFASPADEARLNTLRRSVR